MKKSNIVSRLNNMMEAMDGIREEWESIFGELEQYMIDNDTMVGEQHDMDEIYNELETLGGGKFIPSQECTDWLEGESAGRDVLRGKGGMDGPFGVVVHLTIQLGLPR